MKINKFNLATFVIIFFFSVKVSSQNTTTYQITPEINKKIIRNEKREEIKVYHINVQKIKYHEYEMGEVISKEYKAQLDYLDRNKEYYDKYQKDQFNNVQKFKDDYALCIDLIDKYLISDEKYEVKREYLIQSKKLLISIPNIIINNRGGWFSGMQNALNIDYDDFKSKPNKEYLIKVKESLISFLKRVPDFEKSENCIAYIYGLKNLEKIIKTAPGLVESQTESEREVKLVDINKVDTNIFSGTFKQLPGVVNISNKNIGAPNINKSFLENEIVEFKNVEEFRKVYDDRNTFRDGYVIEDINTKEQYLIPREFITYLSDVKDCMEDIELLNILHNLGYKEYEKEFYDQLKGKYTKLFIKTKTAEIELKLSLYDRLKENKSFLTEFDNDHNKFISLINQCITYTNSLSNYINIYNVKRTNTPLSTVNEWKAKVINSNKLFEQLLPITSKYAYIYSFLESENSSFQDFLDVSIKSGNILGIRN